ncbi:Uncharacterized protein PBTT_03143 [Plasmodiophora brassicae]|uniref:Uncharacterized protein n=1 Tax=Plasmodiophora brassicae TaxID=37360 RepID=A0A0G4J753_PLABS|nr:hypothetical protein PBRA_002934 [Plasmodiophora brassicae]SPQ95418.1 unnamed protein product [Plasmodiophora brassicae]
MEVLDLTYPSSGDETGDATVATVPAAVQSSVPPAVSLVSSDDDGSDSDVPFAARLAADDAVSDREGVPPVDEAVERRRLEARQAALQRTHQVRERQNAPLIRARSSRPLQRLKHAPRQEVDLLPPPVISSAASAPSWAKSSPGASRQKRLRQIALSAPPPLR